MTAEIAVLNKSAVALATDSAVTIQSASAPTRIYESANKLFTLSKYHPVGIMVYGDVGFMGVPWETIVKSYRERLAARSFKTLEGFANDIIKFLDEPSLFAPESAQENYVSLVAGSLFGMIRSNALEEAAKKIEDLGGIEDDSAFLEILRKHIEKERRELSEFEVLPHLPKGYGSLLLRKYRPILAKTRATVFEKISLSSRDTRRLDAVVVNAFTRKVFPIHTGIVVAGFGQEDIFPSARSFKVECHVAGRLKYAVGVGHDVGKEGAGILPFAQQEMVRAFMEGASEDYVSFQDDVWRKGLQGFRQAVLQRFGKELAARKEGLTKLLDDEIGKWLKDAHKEMTQWRREHYVDPVMDMVAVLPKEELAGMAEALVNLTSFKRKVTRGEEQTVGGPIDVAVISKGDGFIWIKRKHYFSTESNPHFCARYFQRAEHGRQSKKDRKV